MRRKIKYCCCRRKYENEEEPEVETHQAKGHRVSIMTQKITKQFEGNNRLNEISSLRKIRLQKQQEIQQKKAENLEREKVAFAKVTQKSMFNHFQNSILQPK